MSQINANFALQKVISGGQTGADFSGVFWAGVWKIETGGTMPKGFLTETGPNPQMAKLFNMTEDSSSKYPPRTLKNVKDADFTLIFGDKSAGSRLTEKYCIQEGKPYFWLKDFNSTKRHIDEIREALKDVKVLNVAGNRYSTNPEVSADTFNSLELIFCTETESE